MKFSTFLLIGWSTTWVTANAQSITKPLTTTEEKALRMESSSIPSGDTLMWTHNGQFGVQFSQVYLKNWAAGGQSNLALLTKLDKSWNYVHTNYGWDTELHLAFGLLHRPEDRVFLKTDDRIEWSTKWGYRATKTGFMTIMANFRSQFARGYALENGVPNQDKLQSNWMAPGYGVIAAGIDYKDDSGNFNLFFAPFTYKATWVLDDSLAQAGAFGVEPGEAFRYELGGYLKIGFITPVAEGITYSLRLDLFTNFIKSPENIDVFSDHVLTLKVNNWLSTTITASLIYDDDVMLNKEPIEIEGQMIPQQGPGIQLKEVLSVGISIQI
jgi:hypothetical protein